MPPVCPDRTAGQGSKVPLALTKQDQTTMKTDYQKKLALKNPTISLNTEYFYDEDADWTIFNSGEPMEQEVPANWICWRVEVSASIIDAGYLFTSTAHLGGLWHENDSPHDRCGDYEFDLIEQALEGLLVKVMGSKTSIFAIQRLIADNKANK